MRLRSIRIAAVLVFILVLCSDCLTGKELYYKFEKGKTYKYSTSLFSKTQGQGSGQQFELTSDANFNFSMTIEDVKDCVFISVVTFDKFSVKINFPLAGYHDSTVTIKEYAGKRIKVRMTDHGKTLSVEPIDVIPPSKIQSLLGIGPAEMFQRLFFELPEKDIDINSTWNKNVPDTTTRNNLKIITKQNVDYKVDSAEKKGSHDCFKIVYTGKGIFEGEGNQNGMDLTVDGTNKFNGTAYVAPEEGAFISTDQTAENDMSVTVTGTQTIAQAMLTTISIHIKLLE